MTKKIEIIEAMPLCDGILQLTHRSKRLTSYESATRHSNGLSVWFVFQGRRTTISSLKDLKRIRIDRKCDLLVWVKDHESVFAHILTPVLNLGRVVSSADLYSFLEEKYGVPVSSKLPRWEGAHVRFLCATFGQTAEPKILDVSLDLESVTMSVTPFIRKSG
jgi:hypothetical protein